MRILVFAPHQDDEVLACGGTIIKRIQAGHQVFIVFMTDGRWGCGKGKDARPEEIKAIRKQEAIQAAKAMGVALENIYFLDFHDRKLNEEITEVKKRLFDLFPLLQPDEIFLPNHKDGHADHCSTNEAVLAILKEAKLTADIYEYFIWDDDYDNRPNDVFAKYNAAENILDILHHKINALFEHKCQMILFSPKQEKPFLNGEFLCRFIRGQEYFVKYRMVGGKIKLLNRILSSWTYLIRKVCSTFAFNANSSRKLDIGIVTGFSNGHGHYLLRWTSSIMALNTKPSMVTIVESGNDPGIDDITRKRCTYLINQLNIPCNYIRLEGRRGIGYTRNHAVNSTNTEWIMYLDVDDMILPNALDEIAKVAPHSDVICAGFKTNIDRKEEDRTIFADPDLQKILGIFRLNSHSPYRKSLWEHSPYIENNGFNENALWIGFAKLKARFIMTKKDYTFNQGQPRIKQ
jgi:LmbE family N-acetylglucosaminyl deacetylase